MSKDISFYVVCSTFALMKFVFSLIALFAMLIQTFQMGIVEADFFINQQEIAATLCENKDKPELHCNGHCQLKKELEKHDDIPAQRLAREMSPFIAIIAVQIPKPVLQLETFGKPSAVSLYPGNYVSEVFHPPGIIFSV